MDCVRPPGSSASACDRRHTGWAEDDRPMSATPPLPFATEKPWTNWGGNQTCTPAFTVRPRDEQEVLDVVRFAVREGLPVRAVGAGHSFTPIVQTGGVLVET